MHECANFQIIISVVCVCVCVSGGGLGGFDCALIEGRQI